MHLSISQQLYHSLLKLITVLQFKIGIFIILKPNAVLYGVVLEEIFLENSTARNRTISIIYKDDIDQSLFLHKRVCQMEEDHSGVKLLVLVSLSLEKDTFFFTLYYQYDELFLRFSVQCTGEPTKFTHIPPPVCDERPFSLFPQLQLRQLPTSCQSVLSESISGWSNKKNAHLRTELTVCRLGSFPTLTEDSMKGTDWFYCKLYSLQNVTK